MKKKRRYGNVRYDARLFAIIFLSILIGFAIGIYFHEPITEELVKGGVLLPELSTLGYAPADIDVDSHILYLSSGCYMLTMIISEDQALSIRRGLDNDVLRPLAHDIMKEITDNFGLEILIIKIESFKDNSYRARIITKQGSKILDIESRPSDAVALAVRMNKTVYVKEDLLKEYGVKTC